MSQVFNSERPQQNSAQYGCDEDRCFYISDFEERDCVIVNTQRGKIRGIVLSTERQSLSIRYMVADGSIRIAEIGDIALLQESQPGWLYGA